MINPRAYLYCRRSTLSWSIKARSLEEAARLRDLGNDRSILILIRVQVGI